MITTAPTIDLTAVFEKVVMNANDAVVITKLDLAPDSDAPEIVFVNPAFTALTGYSFAEAVGHAPHFTPHAAADLETVRRMREALRQRHPFRGELFNVAKDGREYWLDLSIVPLTDSTGQIAYFAAIGRDMTMQKRIALKLEALAHTDPLTGLSNRRHFIEHAEREVDRAGRYARPLSMLMVDLDRFKLVNDTHGHPVGDATLTHAARICESVLRLNDICGRIGGEEFAVLLPETDPEGAGRTAERLREAVEASELVSGTARIKITVSVGVATLLPGQQLAMTELMRRADGALYQAKRDGRNRVVRAPILG